MNILTQLTDAQPVARRFAFLLRKFDTRAWEVAHRRLQCSRDVPHSRIAVVAHILRVKVEYDRREDYTEITIK